MNEKKLQTVLGMSPQKRYEYAIKKMADTEEVWALDGDKGLVLMKSQNGRICLPIWPEEEFALFQAVKSWEGAKSVKISLNSFLERQIDGLEEEGFWLSVFPNDMSSFEVEPRVFLGDMKNELANYGG